MMVAILSPAYFASDYCRKEWEWYVETELAHALPGQGIAPIYVLAHPAYDSGPVDARVRGWVQDLQRRQYIDWRPFWPEGMRALEREDVRRRLEALPAQIAERLRRKAVRDASPNHVPLPSPHFVGRREDLHELRSRLVRGHIGAITALHGIAGIGKSMLAFAYAWGYGFEYPGGRFLIPGANLADLRGGMIGLAEGKGVPLTDDDRQRPDVAFGKVKEAFERGPAALLLIDNLDDPALLSPQAREQGLPQGDHIHVLVTTRVSPDDLPRVECLPLDALSAEDALALLQSFRPIADATQDAEWKAALEIGRRLGGHALAVEVVGVFLRENSAVSCRAFLHGLEQDGITLLEEEVGPEARGRLAWHTESCVARLLEPTLRALAPADLRAVEYAALLPADNVPLPWLRELLQADFPDDLKQTGLRDPSAALLRRLERLRLIVPLEQRRDGGGGTGPHSTDAEPPRLGRIHRLVQQVVAARMGKEAEAARSRILHRYVQDRGKRLSESWGQPGLGWEVLPLRDQALALVRAGEWKSIYLADRINQPLQHLGRLADACNLWQQFILLMERLAAQAPENADYARDLSVSYNKMGDLFRALGDGARARQFYEKDLAVAERLAAQAPENADYARDLSVSYERMGDLFRALGDGARARQFYEKALAVRERLAAQAPENADYARDLSVSYNKMGDLFRALGDGARARQFYEKTLEVRERLAAQAPENADYARDLWVSCWKIAAFLEEGHDEEASRWWRRAYEVLSRMKEAGMFLSPEDEGVFEELRKKLS